MNSEEIIKGETNWESIDFIINYNEKCIMKFLVRPIHRETYIFYLFNNSSNNYYLKCVNYHDFEHFELMKKSSFESEMDRKIEFKIFLKTY